jgi:hypothetical protein
MVELKHPVTQREVLSYIQNVDNPVPECQHAKRPCVLLHVPIKPWMVKLFQYFGLEILT